jgi:hypothetical protein
MNDVNPNDEVTFQLLTRRTLLAGVAGAAVLGSLPITSPAAAHTAIKASSSALQSAWAQYHAAVEAGRIAIENTDRFKRNPEHRAQAYYTLAEAQAMAYNFAIAPRLDHPLVHTHTSWLTHIYTLGGNSADFLYGSIFLDGKRSYRLTGRPGELKLILFQVFSTLMGSPQSKSIGNYDFADFKLNADGTFDVVLSATPHEGNWIRLDPSSSFNYILLRRALADWSDDPGELKLTALDSPPTIDDSSESALIERIQLATDFRKFTVDKWTIGFYDRVLERANGRKNVSAIDPGAPQASELAGSPTSTYANAVYEIKPDEALIAEIDVPTDAAYWSYQLYDVWLRSLDFRNHQTNINMHRAAIDKDGKFRAVVSLTDPGVANWLDPMGRKEGFLVFRNYRSKATPNPDLKLVKLADLRKHLPKDTKWVTPAERQQIIAYRQNGYQKMYQG